jgi:hypothetical protein
VKPQSAAGQSLASTDDSYAESDRVHDLGQHGAHLAGDIFQRVIVDRLH